jgi:NAD(P)H dehydrogenase (quinone)
LFHRPDLLAGLFAASRQGEFEPADPALARLLGRPALSLADVLRAAAGR